MRFLFSLSVIATAFLSTASADGGLTRGVRRRLEDSGGDLVGDVNDVLSEGGGDPAPEVVADPEPEVVADPEPPSEPDAVPLEDQVGQILNDQQQPAPPLEDQVGQILQNSKPSKPVANGDPHFTQFSGHKFDFHGGCDLVLVDNPKFNNGQGMKIHIRTKIRTWWSYIEAAVIQLGDETFEVQSGIEDKLFWVNGEPGDKSLVVDSGRLPYTIGGYPVRFRVRRAGEFQFKIFLADDQFLLIRSVHDFLRVELGEASQGVFAGATGMMGDYNSGKMLARDGTAMEDPDEFGKEWQVLDTEPQMFHSVEGVVQHPEACAMPSVDQEQRRKLREGTISRETAAKACSDASPEEKEDCIFDVLATDETVVAHAYAE